MTNERKSDIMGSKTARRALLFCCVVMLALKPVGCFSWTESKHSISELLIHHVFLDSNYVFCGSDASWGTNAFGLFVFDRRMGTWTNYPGLIDSDSRYGQVKVIEVDGDSVYVTFHTVGTLAFDRQDGFHRKTATRKGSPYRGFKLSVGGASYRIHRDSVIVTEDTGTTVYIPSSQLIPKPTGTKGGPKVLIPIFSHPVPFRDKIYMPYDLMLGAASTYTYGIAVFDVSQREFQFYGSDIFKGTVTGGFVHKSLIVFPTARYVYEGNARPAAGFVAFSPSDPAFSLWRELPLPDEPLAIFQVAQDDKEYWIGTDKGVFRINKRTNEVEHYQIAWGIVAKEGADACATQGGYVVARLDGGIQVELLAVWNGWCEIKSPRNVTGCVEGKYVEEVTLSKDGDRICKFKSLDERERVSDKPDSELMAELDQISIAEHEYKVVARVTKKDQATWYKIELPTVWISMNDLVFQLDQVGY